MYAQFIKLPVEPPGSFVFLCKVVARLVIISVPCRELHSVEVAAGSSHTVTSSTRESIYVKTVTLVLILKSRYCILSQGFSLFYGFSIVFIKLT